MLHSFCPQNGSVAGPWAIEGSPIRDWLLGILRFAVTLERCDGAAVMGPARRWTDLDQAGLNLDLAISPGQAHNSASAFWKQGR